MPDPREHTTVIGPDTHIKGEMVFESSACLLGRFEGRITSKGTLEVGEGANCKASIDAARVVVEGNVEGDIIARERLELHTGAAIHGDITAAKLIVAEGASFVGHCRVGEAAAKADAAKPGRNEPALPAITTLRGPRHANGATPPAAEIESTIAGFEAKLAEFSRTRAATGTGD